MRRLFAPITVIVLLLVIGTVVRFWGTREEELVGLEPRPSASAGVGSAVGRERASAGRPAAAAGVAAAPGAASGVSRAQFAESAPAGADSGVLAIDPILARLTISAESVGAEEPAARDASDLPARAIVSRITDSLRLDNKEGKAFGYQGNMNVVFPGPVVQQAQGNPVFGAGYEVTSRFRHVQNEAGDFCMHEESRSKFGNTKYDGIAYNGDYCYVEGQYGHRDASGKKAGQDELATIVRERHGVRFDPLVMRTLRELFADNASSTDFEPDRGAASKAERYSILPLPPDQRTSRTQIKRLSGEVAFSPEGALERAVYSGDIVLGSGYMKGAPLTFDIHVDAIPEAQLPPLRLP